MGVPGLTSYINNDFNSRYPAFFTAVNISDYKTIIFDGYGLLFKLYCEYQPWFGGRLDQVFGGDYISFAQRCKNLFGKLKAMNIEPIFVFDGAIIF